MCEADKGLAGSPELLWGEASGRSRGQPFPVISCPSHSLRSRGRGAAVGRQFGKETAGLLEVGVEMPRAGEPV